MKYFTVDSWQMESQASSFVWSSVNRRSTEIVFVSLTVSRTAPAIVGGMLEGQSLFGEVFKFDDSHSLSDYTWSFVLLK
jgi:hypothetical protein